MHREIKHITDVSIELDLNKTSQQDKQEAFEKFKQVHPNSYNPKLEYIVVYDNEYCHYSIYELQ